MRILILLILVCLFGCDSDKADINMFVKYWNNANNSKDWTILNLLYDNNVFYYGKQMDINSVLDNKLKFFNKHPDFSEEITGDITIHKLADNLIKCEFIKRSIINGKTGDYPSYLILKKTGDVWKITTEGDLITDKNISNDNNIIPYNQEKTAEDLRDELSTKEGENPQDYLTVKYTWWVNLNDQTVFEGHIYNTATTAIFKDIKIHCYFFTKTRTVLTEKEFTIFEYVEPGKSTYFKYKMNYNNKNTNRASLDVIGATATVAD